MAEYRGDYHIAQGLAGFNQALGAALEKRNEEGKLAQALRKVLDLQEPDAKGEHAAMGLPDLQGKLQGITMQRAQQQAEARVKEMESLSRARDMQTRLGQGQLDQGKAEGEFTRRLQEMVVPPPGPAIGPPVPGMALTPELMLQAAGESGYRMNPEGMAQMMRALATASPQDRMPELTNLGGQDVVYSPHTGQFQFKPMPMSDAEVTPLLLDGKPTGLVRTKDGKTFQMPKETTPFDATLFDKSGDKVLSHSEAAAAREALKTKGQVYPGKKVGARAEPAKDEKAELVVVEKDGKRFRLPKGQLAEAEKHGYKLVK